MRAFEQSHNGFFMLQAKINRKIYVLCSQHPTSIRHPSFHGDKTKPSNWSSKIEGMTQKLHTDVNHSPFFLIGSNEPCAEIRVNLTSVFTVILCFYFFWTTSLISEALERNIGSVHVTRYPYIGYKNFFA